jgi:hypothetical protein
MNENELIDWDTFDWDTEIWGKPNHSRETIQTTLNKTYTDDDWDLFKSEVEYLVVEDYAKTINDAISYVYLNFETIKAENAQAISDFNNWKSN